MLSFDSNSYRAYTQQMNHSESDVSLHIRVRWNICNQNQISHICLNEKTLKRKSRSL
ncbi:hypothetical protein LguiA_008033 [Lonicera macranthoides]